MITDREMRKELERSALKLNETGEVSGGSLYRTEIIAKLFCMTKRRVQQLTKDGVLQVINTPEGRRYDLVPTIQNYVKYLSEKAYGRYHSDAESELKEQKLRAEIALKESQGELHRLKTDIAAGKYISVEEAVLDYKRFFVVFKRFAMSIPAHLTDMISSEIDPLEVRKIEKELQQEITRLLRSFVLAAVPESSESA